MFSQIDDLGGLRLFSQDRPRCLLIAEVAQAHDGSLGFAHAFIDAIASTGADAIKFQTHIAAAESTKWEPWRVKFSIQDHTRYDYWRRMEFTEEQWRGLKVHAKERGLLFLSSPFSVEAVELLSRVGVDCWKIASGEVFDTPVLQRILSMDEPILASTGLATLEEIDTLVATLRPQSAPWAILQCTTSYPCGPEQIGLNLIGDWKARYRCPVGLSDHSGTFFPGLAAAALGACAVEVHVTMSRDMYGPDVSSSITVEELAQLSRGIHFIEQANAYPVDKTTLSPVQLQSRTVFLKSLVFAADLDQGTRLVPQHLAIKKAGAGIPPSRMAEILGRTLLMPVERDQPVTTDILGD